MPRKIFRNLRTTRSVGADLRLMALARRRAESPKALKESTETLKEILTSLMSQKN